MPSTCIENAQYGPALSRSIDHSECPASQAQPVITASRSGLLWPFGSIMHGRLLASLTACLTSSTAGCRLGRFWGQHPPIDSWIRCRQSVTPGVLQFCAVETFYPLGNGNGNGSDPSDKEANGNCLACTVVETWHFFLCLQQLKMQMHSRKGHCRTMTAPAAIWNAFEKRVSVYLHRLSPPSQFAFAFASSVGEGAGYAQYRAEMHFSRVFSWWKSLDLGTVACSLLLDK